MFISLSCCIFTVRYPVASSISLALYFPMRSSFSIIGPAFLGYTPISGSMPLSPEAITGTHPVSSKERKTPVAFSATEKSAKGQSQGTTIRARLSHTERAVAIPAIGPFPVSFWLSAISENPQGAGPFAEEKSRSL